MVGAIACSGNAADEGDTTGTTTGGLPTSVMDNACAPSAGGSVVFSPPSSTFEGSVSVDLQPGDPFAELHYTIDHTPPTADSQRYESPFLFTESTELRVQAFVGAKPVGSPQTAIYIARTFDQPHDLPVLVLDSYGQNVPGAAPGSDPSGEEISREYVDVAVMSFEPDAGATSFAAPPVVAVGSSMGSYENVSIEGWQYEKFESRWAETADWFPVLLADPTFQASLSARWRELRRGVLSDTQIVARIQTLTRGLANAAQRNFEKWPILTTGRVVVFDTPTANTWQGQVAAMHEWLLARASWLDTQW